MAAPQQPPPAQQSDRKGSSAASAAMAAAAAAMQGVACAMMMAKAKTAEEKAMAMMMCAQAAMSALNAQQNKDGEKKASSQPNAMPPIQQMPTANNSKPPDQPKSDEKQLIQTPTPAPPPADTTSFASFEEVPIEEGTSIPVQIPDFTMPNNPRTEEVVATGPTLPSALSVPKSIERAKLSYDDSGKASNNPTPDRALGSHSAVLTEKPNPNLKGLPSDEGGGKGFELRGLARGSAGVPEASETSGGTSEKTEGGKNDNNPLESLLALLGGPQAEGPANAAGDIMNLGSKEDDSQRYNIFEYASYRYYRAVYEDRSLRIRNANFTAMNP